MNKAKCTAEELASLPPVPQRLVRTHPGSHRKSLYLATHASHIEGTPVPDGRQILMDLMEHATKPQFVHAHKWREGDLVIWGNRCTMHLARPFDTPKVPDLRRVTTSDVASTLGTGGMMSTSPHPDLAQLWALPIEEHLLELGTSGELPNISVALCTARYEDVAPKLLELLERAAGGETFDGDEGRMFFRGLHIIGRHRDPLAFKPLLRVLRRLPHEVNELLGNPTSATLARIVAGVFDGDVSALLDAIVNLNTEETARDPLLAAATFLTWEGRITRQAFVEFLTRFDAERLAPDGDTVWFAWAHAITLLGLRDMWPTMLGAAKKDVLPQRSVSLRLRQEGEAMPKAQRAIVSICADGGLGSVLPLEAA